MDLTIEDLVELAKQGDRDALEELIRKIQNTIYGLAIRMLWHPEDAEDATQEILVKIITHLDSFRGKSAFTTWVYSIASNHLLAIRKSRIESKEMTFNDFGRQIDREFSTASPAPALEQSLVVQELMIGCTLGMLICLDRKLRISYILGDIYEIKSENAACILDISPAAFRKRLSRARTLLRDFMQKKCGLINPCAPCRCSRYASRAVEAGLIDPDKLLFAGHPLHGEKNAFTPDQLQKAGELQRIIMLFRSHPDYAAPKRLAEGIKKLVTSEKFSLFNN